MPLSTTIGTTALALRLRPRYAIVLRPLGGARLDSDVEIDFLSYARRVFDVCRKVFFYFALGKSLN